MASEVTIVNEAIFMKMAHGDIEGLKKLAFDYFNDTRRLMTGWLALIESGNFGQLRDDLHRCKGGASLFGLERIVAVIGSCESAAVIEAKDFDVANFEKELTAAEQVILELPG